MSDIETNLLGQWVRGRIPARYGGRYGKTLDHPARDVSGPVLAVTYDTRRGCFVVLIRVRENAHDVDSSVTATLSHFSMARPWS